MVAELDRENGDLKECCHAGDALLLFALGWLRRRKPPSAPGWFTAHPVPLSGFTSPNSRQVPPRPFLSPREVLLCHQAVGNSASRMHYTLKTRSKQGGEDASVHHVCIVFPFRREGTCQ